MSVLDMINYNKKDIEKKIFILEKPDKSEQQIISGSVKNVKYNKEETKKEKTQ